MMRVVCSWCGAEKFAGGVWMDLKHRVDDEQPVSHGVCPVCLDRVEAEAEALEHEEDSDAERN